jgi:hypothetical protein
MRFDAILRPLLPIERGLGHHLLGRKLERLLIGRAWREGSGALVCGVHGNGSLPPLLAQESD